MIIGICGGTGSGKTTVANRILESVRADEVVFIQQDSYYRDLDRMPLEGAGGLTYAQMGRYVSAAKPDDPKGTSDEAAAEKDENGEPVPKRKPKSYQLPARVVS